MVRRVYGTADGVEITFTPSSDGRWRCEVPANLAGQYIIELTAEDYAGNTAYMATVIFTIDTTKLCVDLKWIDIAADTQVDGFPFSEYQKPMDGISVEPELETFELLDRSDEWMLEVTKCELCGRW